MLGVIGIVLSLMLLIYLAYRDVSVLVLAPVCALLAVVFDGNLPVLATYTQIFMGSVGQFVKDYFPLFLLGALFGKLMEDSGSAAKIADVIVRAVGVQRTVLAIVLSCAILTYGGVSLFRDPPAGSAISGRLVVTTAKVTGREASKAPAKSLIPIAVPPMNSSTPTLNPQSAG